ncbi:MAG: hypothetical protein RL490_2088 [Pseudomonadota bacterium]|jgi:AraC family transcriptional regulator
MRPDPFKASTESPITDLLHSPEQWAARITPLPPPIQAVDGGLLRRWAGTDAIMQQPPLDHHYLALHLGGDKRVSRRGDGALRQSEVALHSVTLVPAGAGYLWQTEGPIEYAHLYVTPRRLDRTVREVFDREPAAVNLLPEIGWQDPLVGALLQAMLDPALDGSPDARLARDSWLEALLTRLVLRATTLGAASPRARNVLAPRTLARLKAYITDNLGETVTLDNLAGVAGLSRYHLCRSFRDATGLPPHAWLTRARLDAARRLLRSSDLPVHIIAGRCGFASPNQFATSFRKAMGVTPTQYRRSV